MIYRTSKNNVIEIANEVLSDLFNYQYDYQKFLSYNHIESIIEAHTDRCDANAHIWDLCIISSYCSKLLSPPQNSKRKSSIDQFRGSSWGTKQGSPMFTRIKNNMHKIIKHEKSKKGLTKKNAKNTK